MKVVARIRPLSAAEIERGCTETVVPILANGGDNACADSSNTASDGESMGGDENAPPPSAFQSPKIGIRKAFAGIAHSAAANDGGDADDAHSDLPAPASTSLLAGGNVHIDNATNRVTSSGSKSSPTAAVPKQFDYDAVFSSETSQRTVYDLSVGDAVKRNVFRGYNTTIIAYGQTSSGKTYTMNGGPTPATAEDSSPSSPSQLAAPAADLSLAESDGIIPRAIHDLFEETQATEKREARIHLSYLEIYNDTIRDLLGSGADPGNQENLPLLDDGHGVSVRGLSSTEVRTAGEAKELMDLASLRRMTGVSFCREKGGL